VDRPWQLPAPGTQAIAAVLGLALLSTALAYILFFRILATVGATNVLLVTFLIPLSAILLGIAFLDETLQARHLAGMALLGAGLGAIDGRPGRAPRGGGPGGGDRRRAVGKGAGKRGLRSRSPRSRPCVPRSSRRAGAMRTRRRARSRTAT